MDDKKQNVGARENSGPMESTDGKTNRPPLPSKPNLPKAKPLPSKAEHDNSQTTNVGQHVAIMQESQTAEHLAVGTAVKNAAGGINVLCPSCDAKLKFNPQLAGHAVKCSKCKKQFRFPAQCRTSSAESSVATPRLSKPPVRSASLTQVNIDPSDTTPLPSDLAPVAAADKQVQRQKSNNRFVKRITVPLALVFVVSVIWIVMLIASNNVDTLRQDLEDLGNAHKADHSITSYQSAFPILGLSIAVFGVLPLSAAILNWNWAFEEPAPFVEENFTLSQRRIVIGSVGIVFIVIGILVSAGIGF